jgi:predicted Fe-S protein YdhL (DUF1289 family)
MDKSVIDTPCIGICSTVYGDVVCRGCKRFYREIIDWNGFDHSQKHAVYQRLSTLMSQVVMRFLRVLDDDLLKQQLKNHSIRFHSTDDALCWAHHLLRVGGDKLHDLQHYGLAVQPEFESCSLRELFTLMDEDLYERAGEVYVEKLNI